MKKRFMKKESYEKECMEHRYMYGCGCHCGSAVYGLGFIGAAIYYISHATTFWMGFLGILKALVWPAFVVFEALKFLGV